MKLELPGILFKAAIMLFSGLLLAVITMPIQAACTGCLCPGDPCGLCPLPAMKDTLPKPDESETCARIREKIPPISEPPGSNEYFSSLDRSAMECIRQGGDVIKNSRRNQEFPSRVYCKPPVAPVIK